MFGILPCRVDLIVYYQNFTVEAWIYLALRMRHYDRGGRPEVLYASRPAGLINDGMHRYIRHPNYLGEMVIYLALALMVWHWLPFVVLLWVWGGLFSVNMIMKKASMSRYPEWAAYKKRTWWLIPFLL